MAGKAETTLLTVCADAKPDEALLFVTDDTSRPIADIMWAAADDYPDKSIVHMPDRNMHGEEPTRAVAAAMSAADVIFAATKFSLFHTSARRNAVAKGARYVNMADYNESMFQKGGLFADFIKQGQLMDRVSDRIEGEEIHITTPGGTDIRASIKGRGAVRQYGRSLKPGASSSPPDIETALGPVEGTACGVVYIDGGIPHPALGVLREPIKLTLENGKIIAFEGGEEAKTLEKIMADFDDEWVYHLAEIGIGFNDQSTLSGSMLEDEGVMGTVHFGFGSNITFGGVIESNNHLDMVFCSPTIHVDGRLVYQEGQPVLTEEEYA